jgi:hypothetical protein
MQPVTQNLRQQPSVEDRNQKAASFASPRAQIIIASALCVALSLGVSYWIGWAEGAAKTAAIEQRAEQQKEGLEKNTGQLQQRLSSAEQRIKLLEARRDLHRALMALELDNFGTARKQLAKTHQLISNHKPIPGSPLSELNEALLRVELAVTADPLPLRLELTQLAQDFDEILNQS